MESEELDKVKRLQATTEHYLTSFAESLLASRNRPASLADTSNIQRGMLRLAASEAIAEAQSTDSVRVQPKP